MITKRRARTAALTLAAAAAFTFAGAGAAQASPAIPLTGGQEAPKPNAFGAHGSFSYAIDGTEFCYTLEVDGLSTPAVAAHVHVAPRNVAGPVVIPLDVGAPRASRSRPATTISTPTLPKPIEATRARTTSTCTRRTTSPGRSADS